MTSPAVTRAGWLALPAWSLAFALVAAVALTYLAVWHAGFIWDDDQLLTSNPHLASLQGLREIWTTKAADICPLTITTLWLEYRLWALAPLPYHLANLCLHAACAILLWRVLLNLRLPGAWLGAALWALHPVQVESVAWIAESKNEQSGFFFLLAILFFLRSALRSNVTRWDVCAWIAAALAMASKTSTMILPLILGLLAYRTLGRWDWSILRKTAPAYLFSVAAGSLSLWSQWLSPTTRSTMHLMQTWPERIAIAGNVFWFYLGKLVWPHPLALVYPRWEIDPHRLLTYIPLLGVITIALSVWWYRGRWASAVRSALGTFLICLIPVAGIVEISYFRHSFVADHFLYLASMGPLALAGAGLSQMRWRAAFAGVLLLALGTTSGLRARVFRNQDTVSADTLSKNPRSWLAYGARGRAAEVAGRVNDAIADYQRALQEEPLSVECHNNLGNMLLRAGRVPEAAAQYRLTIDLDPEHPSAYSGLADAEALLGHTDEAIVQYHKALAIDPEEMVVHNNLGNLYLQLGRFADAVTEYRQVLRTAPDRVIARDRLGVALLETGQVAAAIPELQQAARSTPQNAFIHFDLGNALFRAGRADDALTEFKQATKLDPPNPNYRNNLGNALAKLGRLDEALAEFRECVRLDPKYERAHMNLGNILAYRGEYGEAVQELQQAIALDPNDAVAHGKLGGVFLQTAQYDGAIAQLETAVRLKPDYEQARDDLERARQSAPALGETK